MRTKYPQPIQKLISSDTIQMPNLTGLLSKAQGCTRLTVLTFENPRSPPEVPAHTNLGGIRASSTTHSQVRKKHHTVRISVLGSFPGQSPGLPQFPHLPPGVPSERPRALCQSLECQAGRCTQVLHFTLPTISVHFHRS